MTILPGLLLLEPTSHDHKIQVAWEDGLVVKCDRNTWEADGKIGLSSTVSDLRGDNDLEFVKQAGFFSLLHLVGKRNNRPREEIKGNLKHFAIASARSLHLGGKQGLPP